MLSLFKIAPARRKTMAALKPFVECVDRPPTSKGASDWLQPHVLGFLSTVVTLLAEDSKGPLRSYSLGAIQASVLVSITGSSAELVGEEITLLSSRSDPEFMAGCRAAYHFVDALAVERHRHISDKAGVGPFVPEQATGEIASPLTIMPNFELGDDSGLNAHGLWREHVLFYLTRGSTRV